MNEGTNIPNNSEIDKALKEFETKSQTEQTQKTPKAPEVLKASPIPQKEVSGISFETDSWGAVKYYHETATPKMVQLVMKFSGGAIKEQKQAEYILFGFVIVAILVSLFLFFSNVSSNPKTSKYSLPSGQFIPK